MAVFSAQLAGEAEAGLLVHVVHRAIRDSALY
jgi:hypothetical protein